MFVPKQKTYYIAILEFTAPVDQRLRQYTTTEQEIKNFFKKKQVPMFYNQIAKLLNGYGSYEFLTKSLLSTGLVLYNESNVRMVGLAKDPSFLAPLLK